MGFNGIYDDIPSGNDLRFAIENGPVEIVDLPIDSMVDLSIAKFVGLPGRVDVMIFPWSPWCIFRRPIFDRNSWKWTWDDDNGKWGLWNWVTGEKKNG